MRLCNVFIPFSIFISQNNVLPFELKKLCQLFKFQNAFEPVVQQLTSFKVSGKWEIMSPAPHLFNSTVVTSLP